MIRLTIKQLQHIVNGQLVAIKNSDTVIDEVSIDSRNIAQNSLFIAIAGENFDGHDFVEQSIASGAVVALVNQKINDILPQIIVENTHNALGEIAAWVRKQSGAKIVALTGSSGKTSVKEMTAAILAHCGNTLFTKGNYNNDIGVPLTLLRLTKEDEFAVIELGANHIGEIAYTTKIVSPQSALINNIAAAHIEGFGSLAGVAKAKSEIFLGLPADGTAIVNLDSCSEDWFSSLTDYKLNTFSLDKTTADYYASQIRQHSVTEFLLHTPKGEIMVTLPLIGLHNVCNAVASASLAMSVGASLSDVQLGLGQVEPVKGRLYPIELNDQHIILDDSYNANMGSMAAAIDVLSQQSGYRVFVVGDMAELGKDSEKYHQQIGEKAKLAGLDCVVSVGKDSALVSQFSGIGHHFFSKLDAALFLHTILKQKEKQKVTLLVKGSRSARMEEIIDSIKNIQD